MAARTFSEDVLSVLERLKADELCRAATAQFLGVAKAPTATEQGALADEIRRLHDLSTQHLADASDANVEQLRRMFLAVVKDLRSVLSVLAIQLVRLRDAADDETSRRAIAMQTRRMHAPIANRLGIWQLKWELEDLSFRYLEPQVYRRIAGMLDGRRAEREAFIDEVRIQLGQKLELEGIAADITGRPKHLFSIWRKMQRKGLGIHELYDLRAVRVLVEDVATCYATLGAVHALWAPIPGEFDDYVAKPKPNGYRSLHTAVVGPEDKALEVQIRTRQMHEDSELGVAAHWRYKEGAASDRAYVQKISWMRQLLEGVDQDHAAAERGTVDRVYALTPRGKVIDLPPGATVLDFAYHVHTDVGHRCRGAKVNGRIVPLTRQVAQGDRIEILTASNAEPSRDWLNPHSGYLRGARSRQKVRQWFRRADFDRNRQAGEDAIDRELERLGLEAVDLEPLAHKHNFRAVDDLCAAVGLGEVTVGHVARYVEEQVRPVDELALLTRARKSERAHAEGEGVAISGVGDLLTTLAKCCSPVPGEKIAGYVTRGRGVTVHRADCPNAVRLLRDEPSRVIDVDWRIAAGADYRAHIAVTAIDRKGLLKDVTTALSAEHAEIAGVNTLTDKRNGIKRLNFDIYVTGLDHVALLLSRLAAVPNVLECRRVPSGSGHVALTGAGRG